MLRFVVHPCGDPSRLEIRCVTRAAFPSFQSSFVWTAPPISACRLPLLDGNGVSRTIPAHRQYLYNIPNRLSLVKFLWPASYGERTFVLKRVYARISIILFALGIVSIFLCVILGTLPVIYPIIFALLGVVFFVASTVVRIVFLKCLSCGKSHNRPQWTSESTFYCPYCGKPFEYEK